MSGAGPTLLGVVEDEAEDLDHRLDGGARVLVAVERHADARAEAVDVVALEGKVRKPHLLARGVRLDRKRHHVARRLDVGVPVDDRRRVLRPDARVARVEAERLRVDGADGGPEADLAEVRDVLAPVVHRLREAVAQPLVEPDDAVLEEKDDLPARLRDAAALQAPASRRRSRGRTPCTRCSSGGSCTPRASTARGSRARRSAGQSRRADRREELVLVRAAQALLEPLPPEVDDVRHRSAF